MFASMKLELVQIRCMHDLNVTKMLPLELVEWKYFGEETSATYSSLVRAIRLIFLRYPSTP